MARLALDAVVVDFDERRIERDGAHLTLTPMEHQLLAYLVANPNRIVTHGELLENVWGYHPNTRTFTIYATINRLRKKVERDPRAPRHIVNRPGVGYRFVLDRRAEGAVDAPRMRTSFVGRQAELQALRSDPAPLVTLVGPAGVGKTRLAHALASVEGALWVDLEPCRTAAEVACAVAEALGVPPGDDDPAEVVGRALADRGGRLVLDHFDHAVAAGADTVGRWRDHARLVVTSRQRLHLQGERVLEVGALPVDDAVDLFLDRARAVRPSLNADRDTVVAVVDALDRLPLALELAADRLRMMEVADLVAALDRRLEVLAHGASDRPARHQSLRGALQDSWDLLEPAEREALSQLAVLQSPFTLATAEAICALPDDAPWIGDVVQALVDHSLLARVDGPAPARLGFLRAVRDFAAEQLTDAEAPADRHLACFTALRPDRRHLDDLWAAAAHANATDAHDAHGAVLVHLADLLRHTGPFGPITTQLEALLVVAPTVAGRRQIVRLLAELLRAAGEFQRGADVLAPEVEGASGALRALYASLLLRCGDLDAAELELDRALTQCEAERDLEGQGTVHMAQGIAAFHRGDREASETCFRRAIDLYGAAEAPHLQSTAWNNLANRLRARADFAGASAAFERATELVDPGDVRTRALLTGNLGAVHMVQGHDARSEALLTDAIAIHRRVGDRLREANTLVNLGALRGATGRPVPARQALERALSLAQQIGSTYTEALAAGALGDVALWHGSPDEARRRFEHTLALADVARRPDIAAAFGAARAVALARGGDVPAGRLALEVAVAHRDHLGPLERIKLACCQAELADDAAACAAYLDDAERRAVELGLTGNPDLQRWFAAVRSRRAPPA